MLLLLAATAILAQGQTQAAPAPPPPAANTVSGVTVTPSAPPPPLSATVNVAGSDDALSRDFVAIWPSTAYQARADGHVTLVCRIDVHGLAERCRVASETPAGKGFGAAAQEFRSTLKLAPAKGPDGRPIAAEMSINLTFKAPDTQSELGSLEKTARAGSDELDISNLNLRGNPLAMREVTMVDDPVWIRAATFDDLAAAYPAKGAGAEGYAAAHCMVERSGGRAGELHNCQIIKEEPHGQGFDKAALAVAARFRIDPAALIRAPRRSALWVDIPIRLPPPAELRDRTVMAPIWLLGIDPRAAPKVFPPEAVAAGLATGRGVVRCTVAVDGTMTDCAPEPGEPDGLGFSQAATLLAAKMRMNLWSADGAPVTGGVVHIPIRLNLKGSGADAGG